MDLYNVNDNLNTHLDYTINELCNKSYEILNTLNNRHHIFIKYKTDFSTIDDCEGFLEKLKEKKEEANITKKDIEKKILKTMINDEEEKNKLKSEYEMQKAELDEEVIEATKDSENLASIEENKYKNKFEEKEILVEQLNDIGQDDQQSIIETYENEEFSKADSEFKNSIEEINKKYIVKEEKLEYTNEEIKLKNQYLDEIQKIKSYSENPFYNNFITSFGLNKYLN